MVKRERVRRPRVDFSEDSIVYEASDWSLQILYEYIRDFLDVDSVYPGYHIHMDPWGEMEPDSLPLVLIYENNEGWKPVGPTLAQNMAQPEANAWLAV